MRSELPLALIALVAFSAVWGFGNLKVAHRASGLHPPSSTAGTALACHGNEPKNAEPHILLETALDGLADRTAIETTAISSRQFENSGHITGDHTSQTLPEQVPFFSLTLFEALLKLDYSGHLSATMPDAQHDCIYSDELVNAETVDLFETALNEPQVAYRLSPKIHAADVDGYREMQEQCWCTQVNSARHLQVPHLPSKFSSSTELTDPPPAPVSEPWQTQTPRPKLSNIELRSAGRAAGLQGVLGPDVQLDCTSSAELQERCLSSELQSPHQVQIPHWHDTQRYSTELLTQSKGDAVHDHIDALQYPAYLSPSRLLLLELEAELTHVLNLLNSVDLPRAYLDNALGRDLIRPPLLPQCHSFAHSCCTSGLMRSACIQQLHLSHKQAAISEAGAVLTNMPLQLLHHLLQGPVALLLNDTLDISLIPTILLPHSQCHNSAYGCCSYGLLRNACARSSHKLNATLGADVVLIAVQVSRAPPLCLEPAPGRHSTSFLPQSFQNKNTPTLQPMPMLQAFVKAQSLISAHLDADNRPLHACLVTLLSHALKGTLSGMHDLFIQVHMCWVGNQISDLHLHTQNLHMTVAGTHLHGRQFTMVSNAALEDAASLSWLCCRLLRAIQVTQAWATYLTTITTRSASPSRKLLRQLNRLPTPKLPLNKGSQRPWEDGLALP